MQDIITACLGDVNIYIYTRISFCKIVYFRRYDLIINKLAVDSGISTTDYRFLNILIISVLYFHVLSTC